MVGIGSTHELMKHTYEVFKSTSRIQWQDAKIIIKHGSSRFSQRALVNTACHQPSSSIRAGEFLEAISLSRTGGASSRESVSLLLANTYEQHALV
jgi:hypothetical protein